MINISRKKIVRKSDPSYNEDREERNRAFDIKPEAIYFCSSEQDVIDALNYAKLYNLEVRLRSGRHSYEAFSTANGALIIDVSFINTISLSDDKKTVRLGAGCLLYDIYQQLWKEKLTIAAGSCGTVGIAGLALGGGIGFSARRIGLSCDNIVSLDIVTAQKKHLTINRDVEPDLFWACCGAGGGNFGVVTHITMRTHPVSIVGLFNITYPWDMLEDIMVNWFATQQNASENLMLFARVGCVKNGKITSFGQYFGLQKEMEEQIQALVHIKGAQTTLKEVNFFEAVKEHAGSIKPHTMHFQQQKPFKARSMFVKKTFGPEAMNILRTYHTRDDCPATAITIFDSWGKQTAIPPKDYNAFAHRDAIASIQNLVTWTKGEDKSPLVKWSGEFAQALRQYTQGSYINYPDIDLPNWQQEYYGDHYERLVSIKKAYDPDNIFDFQQSIEVM